VSTRNNIFKDQDKDQEAITAEIITTTLKITTTLVTLIKIMITIKIVIALTILTLSIIKTTDPHGVLVRIILTTLNHRIVIIIMLEIRIEIIKQGTIKIDSKKITEITHRGKITNLRAEQRMARLMSTIKTLNKIQMKIIPPARAYMSPLVFVL
jgi:Na+-transporting NADH:ubiquinone oxidoreductase subunit NqrD